ncbi:hypothetical protein K474DRAFT_1712638 [Panus rudis PR-1116 ss-1]|nr:hypothetical protein K474DRAFT_1712638 [Panus rudis PR-1116 ss-1]
MFFSKFIYSVFAVASIATVGFASPVAQPAGELTARQSSDAVSEIESFQSTISPLIDQLTQAAATGADPTPSVNQLSSAFGSSTDSFNKKSGVLVDADAVVFVDVAVDIVAKLVIALAKVRLNLVVDAKVDLFLSAWLTALDKFHPGVALQIGKGIPKADISLFASVKLLLSAKVLVLVNVLGIVKV